MKLYGGIDLHSNNNVIVIIDEKGEVKARKRLENDLNLVLRFLAPFTTELTGLVVESTFNWYWLVDGLMDAAFKIHLANTSAIQQYSGLKHADDNSDAEWLAEMLRLEILPEGYIYPKMLRSARDLMRKRMQLVQQATSNLLAIQGLYMRHLSYKLSGNSIKLLTEEKVKRDFDMTNVSYAVKSNLAVMMCLKEHIKGIENELLGQVKLAPEFLQLTSIDGIGKILGLTIMLETGDINRFDKGGNYASHCRCISGARYSNGKKKGKINSKKW
jgi:transposase